MDAVALALVDHRPELDAVGIGVADRQAGGLLGEAADELVGDLRGDDVPTDGHADLALVAESAERGRVDRAFEVGVAEHDERVVAAELEVGALEVASGCLTDLPAGLGRACERDDSHLAGGDQRLPDVGAPREDVQQPFWQAGLLEHRGRRARRRSPLCAGPA